MTEIPEIITDGAVIESDIHSLPGETTYAGVTSFLRRPYHKDPVSYTHLTLPTNREV